LKYEEDKIFLNNFVGYFPGGNFRKLNIRPKISLDLDKILSEENFNISEFERLNKKNLELCQQCVNLYKNAGKILSNKEQIIDNKIKNEWEYVENQLNNLLLPVYYKMLDLGYSCGELTA
jgi:hypothetical protein